MTDLKPCPFCGGINIIHSGFRMYCHTCGAEGPDADSADESAAIAAWNRRAQPAQAGAEPVAWIPKAKQMPPPGERVFWMDTDTNMIGYDVWAGEDFLWMPSHWMPIPALNESTPEALYTHPPARVPLTDEEIEDVWNFLVAKYIEDVDHAYWSRCDFEFARAIEAAHGITK